MSPSRVAVFVSGEGSTFAAVADGLGAGVECCDDQTLKLLTARRVQLVVLAGASVKSNRP